MTTESAYELLRIDKRVAELLRDRDPALYDALHAEVLAEPRRPRGRPKKPKAPCSFDGCDRPAETRGMCGAHYGQWKTGKPLRPVRPYGQPPTRDPEERARSAEMWRLFSEEGLYYRQIGDLFGVTRERVRQILVRDYGYGLMGLVRFRAEARLRHADYLASRWAMCFVCGTVFRLGGGAGSGGWAACPEHHTPRGIQQQLRLICDEERHAQHRQIMGVIDERRGRKPQRTWEVWNPGRTRFRWVIRGSRAHAILTEAWAKGWPIIDRLPDPIREQLAEEANEPQGATA